MTNEEQTGGDALSIIAWLTGVSDEATAQRLARQGRIKDGEAGALVSWLTSRSNVVWQETVSPTVVAAAPTFKRRWVRVVAIAAGVALILLAVVPTSLPRSRPALQIEVAEIWPQAAGARGAGADFAPRVNAEGAIAIPENEFSVALESPRSGFATIVLSNDSHTLVFPQPNQTAIKVQAGVKRSYSPLALLEPSTSALVVITERRVDDEVREVVERSMHASGDKTPLVEGIRERLANAGHKWMAIGHVRLTLDGALGSQR